MCREVWSAFAYPTQFHGPRRSDHCHSRSPGHIASDEGVAVLYVRVPVMADPVSSVAYAIEAALRALHGHLGLLLPTMGIVIGIIGLVTLNYWQLVRAFPEGGGSPEAAGRAFGEEWSFLPIGALVVDFALTIAISIAAAGSAIIAYVPAIAPARIPIALGLTVLVAASPIRSWWAAARRSSRLWTLGEPEPGRGPGRLPTACSRPDTRPDAEYPTSDRRRAGSRARTPRGRSRSASGTRGPGAARTFGDDSSALPLVGPTARGLSVRRAVARAGATTSVSRPFRPS